MVQNGLAKIVPHHQDYSFLHTFGAVIPDPKGLPENFSIYDGRSIPNQEYEDERFTPALPPLPYGCTGETGTFDAGIQDADLYNPQDLYESTPGLPEQGRDMRLALKTLQNRGPLKANGAFGPKRTDYFNVYGAGKIDDFDAARIALWINQNEKRCVWVGTYWYAEFAVPNLDGTLPTPSYNTKEASLHAHLMTGWKTINGRLYLEDISWQGMHYGDKGKVYFSREEYNALMRQTYTGAFTQTKLAQKLDTPIMTLGMQVYVDHLVYFILQLFNLNQKKSL